VLEPRYKAILKKINRRIFQLNTVRKIAELAKRNGLTEKQTQDLKQIEDELLEMHLEKSNLIENFTNLRSLIKNAEAKTK
jgi:phosphopentomutase